MYGSQQLYQTENSTATTDVLEITHQNLSFGKMQPPWEEELCN